MEWRSERTAWDGPKPAAITVEAESAILSAALDLFAAKNFSSVRTIDIAKVTGFNQALIFYYFTNKEELYRRALALAIERAFQSFRMTRTASMSRPISFSRGSTTISALMILIAKLIKLSIDYVSTAERKVSIDRAIRTFYDEERLLLQSAIEAGVASGKFGRVDADTDGDVHLDLPRWRVRSRHGASGFQTDPGDPRIEIVHAEPSTAGRDDQAAGAVMAFKPMSPGAHRPPRGPVDSKFHQDGQSIFFAEPDDRGDGAVKRTPAIRICCPTT